MAGKAWRTNKGRFVNRPLAVCLARSLPLKKIQMLLSMSQLSSSQTQRAACANFVVLHRWKTNHTKFRIPFKCWRRPWFAPVMREHKRDSRPLVFDTHTIIDTNESLCWRVRGEASDVVNCSAENWSDDTTKIQVQRGELIVAFASSSQSNRFTDRLSRKDEKGEINVVQWENRSMETWDKNRKHDVLRTGYSERCPRRWHVKSSRETSK